MFSCSFFSVLVWICEKALNTNGLLAICACICSYMSMLNLLSVNCDSISTCVSNIFLFATMSSNGIAMATTDRIHVSSILSHTSGHIC